MGETATVDGGSTLFAGISVRPSMVPPVTNTPEPEVTIDFRAF